MTNKEYFSQTNTGGMFASLGFEYQDLCALYFLFSFINQDNFDWIAMEQMDDITVHFYSGRTLSIQIKRNELNPRVVAEYLKELSYDPDMPVYHPGAETEYFKIFVGYSINDKLKTLLDYRKNYETAQQNLTDSQCRVIRFELQEKLDAYGIPFDRFLCCEFRQFGDQHALTDHVEQLILNWMFNNGIDCNDYNSKYFLTFLKGRMMELRCSRGPVAKSQLFSDLFQNGCFQVKSFYEEPCPSNYTSKNNAPVSLDSYPDSFWNQLCQYLTSEYQDTVKLKRLLDTWADILEVPYPSSFQKDSLNQYTQRLIFKEMKPDTGTVPEKVNDCIQKALELDVLSEEQLYSMASCPEIKDQFFKRR